MYQGLLAQAPQLKILGAHLKFGKYFGNLCA